MKSTKVKTKEAGEKGNFKTVGKKALQDDFGITSKLHPVPRRRATEVVFVGSLHPEPVP